MPVGSFLAGVLPVSVLDQATTPRRLVQRNDGSTVCSLTLPIATCKQSSPVGVWRGCVTPLYRLMISRYGRGAAFPHSLGDGNFAHHRPSSCLAVCRREHVLPRDSALGDRFEAKKRATDALFALPQCEKQGRLASLRQTARSTSYPPIPRVACGRAVSGERIAPAFVVRPQRGSGQDLAGNRRHE